MATFKEYLGARLNTTAKDIVGAINELAAKITAAGCPFRVGMYILTTDGTNPATYYPGTTWNLEMLDRMPIGAGASYAIGTEGGNKDAAVISHSHTISHTHSTPATNTGGQSASHEHTYQYSNGTSTGVNGEQYMTKWVQAGGTGSGESTWGMNANHTHQLPGMTTNSQSTTASGTAGGAGTNANMPPYKAIYFWRRTA